MSTYWATEYMFLRPKTIEIFFLQTLHFFHTFPTENVMSWKICFNFSSNHFQIPKKDFLGQLYIGQRQGNVINLNFPQFFLNLVKIFGKMLKIFKFFKNFNFSKIYKYVILELKIHFFLGYSAFI